MRTDMGGTQGNSARCPLLCTVFDRAPLTPSDQCTLLTSSRLSGRIAIGGKHGPPTTICFCITSGAKAPSNLVSRQGAPTMWSDERRAKNGWNPLRREAFFVRIVGLPPPLGNPKKRSDRAIWPHQSGSHKTSSDYETDFAGSRRVEGSQAGQNQF